MDFVGWIRDYGLVAATVALVLATIAIATFTARLASATRELTAATRNLAAEATTARTEASARRQQDLSRAAIVEATENCRRWLRHEPSINRDIATMRSTALEFGALARLLRSLDLPADVGAYLLWLRGYLTDLQARYDATIIAAGDDRHKATLDARGMWQVELDMLQTLACLIRAHAKATPELAPTAEVITAPAWLRFRPAPENSRMFERIGQEAHSMAPPFPAGDAYATCTIEARDKAGAEMLARQKAWMSSAPTGNP